MKLFNILVHLLAETNRHAGHADILRKQLDDKPATLNSLLTNAPELIKPPKPQHQEVFPDG